MSIKVTLNSLGKDTIKLFKKMPELYKDTVKSTLSNVAFTMSNRAKKHLPNHNIVRTQYTTKGIQYTKSNNASTIEKLSSSYGADQKRKYLELQETGFQTKKLKPTLQTRVSKDMKKRMKKTKYLNALQKISTKNIPRAHSVRFIAHLYRQGIAKWNSQDVIQVNHPITSTIKYPDGYYQFSKRPRKKGKGFVSLIPLFRKRKPEHIAPSRWMSKVNKTLKQSQWNKSFKQALLYYLR